VAIASFVIGEVPLLEGVLMKVEWEASSLGAYHSFPSSIIPLEDGVPFTTSHASIGALLGSSFEAHQGALNGHSLLMAFH
jgi:hypothetical protein